MAIGESTICIIWNNYFTLAEKIKALEYAQRSTNSF